MIERPAETTLAWYARWVFESFSTPSKSDTWRSKMAQKEKERIFILVSRKIIQFFNPITNTSLFTYFNDVKEGQNFQDILDSTTHISFWKLVYNLDHAIL